MDALAFLDRPQLQPLYVVHGDQDFLRRIVQSAIKRLVFGEIDADNGGEFGSSTFAGESATFADVMDELHTAPFFGERRLITVQNADNFVTRNRALLEKALAALPASGVLVLDVKTWVSTTRLAKMVKESATIFCKAPASHRLPQWCVKWAAAKHKKQLTAAAASLLLELIGPEMGLLDQELLKLAIYVGDRQRIDVDDVDKLVSRGRAQKTWAIFDAIGAGQSKEALTILGHLLDQGEEPLALLGAFGWQLRRLAKAYRLVMRGRPLSVALQEAGIPPFSLKSAEQQLKHLGRRRAERLYDWLLEADQGLKGASSLPERTLLERLVIRLAAKLPATS